MRKYNKCLFKKRIYQYSSILKRYLCYRKCRSPKRYIYVLIHRISTNHILLMYLTMPLKKNKNLYKSIVFIHYWRAWNSLPCYVSKNSYYVCTLTQLWKFVLIIGISLGTFIFIEDEILSVLKYILYIYEEYIIRIMSYLNIYT